MNRIHDMVAAVATSLDGECEHFEQHSQISIGLGTRRQEVTIRLDNDDYEMTSVVLSSSVVTASDEGWRALARLAWQRNADSEIVAFTFDKRDRLVGRIRHPAATLDAKELSLYIRSLVRECDRFEYLLSGQDRF